MREQGYSFEADDLLPDIKKSLEDFVLLVKSELSKKDDRYWAELNAKRQVRIALAQKVSPIELELVSPTEDFRTSDPRIAIRATLASPLKIRSAQIYLNGQEASISSSFQRGATSTPLESKNPEVLLPGENTIRFEATDESGILFQKKLSVYHVPAAPVAISSVSSHDASQFDLELDLNRRRQLALVIGIDQYEMWPRLLNARRDAQAVARVLSEEYGFERVIELYDQDATRDAIFARFKELVDLIEGGEDVLIYFSGHGHFDETLNRGYWAPVDARKETDFLPNSEIHDYLKAMNRKKVGHVFLVADSCFSGSFINVTRALTVRPLDVSDEHAVEKYLQKLYSSPGRQALTSGSLEPVSDGGADGHSLFAWYFLKCMKAPEHDAFTATELAARVQRLVGDQSGQTPRLGLIEAAGHGGGEFIFVRKKM